MRNQRVRREQVLRGSWVVVASLLAAMLGAGDAGAVPTAPAALSRQVYTANHGTNLPGTLVRSEGQPAVSDADVNAAYDNLGNGHACLADLFGRDSADGHGLLLRASVHYSTAYLGAFWNTSQFVFGDGDNSNLGPTARDPDIVTHLLGLATNQYEANLVFSNESGAVATAMADVLAAVCDWHLNGAVTPDTWKIDEDAWTPSTPGDALRYMDNPTVDGQSRDYWPERYIGPDDQGGVHINSGIASLAFYLLSEGGVHPRGKTTVFVDGIGIERAAQIWYRAFTNIWSSTTNLSAARNGVVTAANELYGSAVGRSAHNAFAAVGIREGVPADRAPTASALPLTTNEDTPVPFTLPVSDTDGDDVDCSVDPSPDVVLDGETCTGTFSPPADANGPFSFPYDATDGVLTSSNTVSITVTPVNDAPTSQPVTATGEVRQRIEFAPDVADVDGDSMSCSTATAGATIALDCSRGTFTSTVPGDHLVDFLVSDGHGGSTIGTATITVLTPPTVNVADWTGAEGGLAEFVVSLDRAALADVFVGYTTLHGGTAQGGVDYVVTKSKVRILAGQTTGVARVTVLADSLDEPDETFSIRLSRPRGATIVDGLARGKIIDDDG